MKSPLVRLTMPDGTVRTIRATLGKDVMMTDRRFIQLFDLVLDRPAHPRPHLDRELVWLRECVSIEEPDGERFAETKRFIVGTLDVIERHVKDGTLRGGSKHVH